VLSEPMKQARLLFAASLSTQTRRVLAAIWFRKSVCFSASRGLMAMPSTPPARRALTNSCCASIVEFVKKRKSTSTLPRFCAALLQPCRTVAQKSFLVLVTKAIRHFFIDGLFAAGWSFLSQPSQRAKTHRARRNECIFFIVEKLGLIHRVQGYASRKNTFIRDR